MFDMDISRQFELCRSAQSKNCFEIFLAMLSTKFLNLELDQIDPEIHSVMGQIGDFIGADRCFIFLLSENKTHHSIAHIWTASEIQPAQDMVGMIVQDNFPWLGEMMLQHQDIVINHLDDIPPVAVKEKQYCLKIGIQSFIMTPIIFQDEVLGSIGLDMIKEEKLWDKEIIGRIKLLGEILANAIVRKQKDIEINELKKKLETENYYLREELKLNYEHGEIIGQSSAIKRILMQSEQVAPTGSNVLILGETGTGKELLAHTIHRISSRSDRPMISVNCAALPSTLIESELFGREKGAYTGALSKQVGRFEMANGSTLFLDEIGELPLEMQSKLLRVIQNGEFERLGSSKTIKVDVRLIVATNRHLEDMVKAGIFREDLYYRLNVFPITLPPLRERREDIPLLVWALIKELEKKLGFKVEEISKQSMNALSHYSWPGNIRELKNAIERAMILNQGPRLEIKPEIYINKQINKHDSMSMTLDEVESEHILAVLKQTNGRIRGENGAAVILGLKPTTLESRIKRLEIKYKS